MRSFLSVSSAAFFCLALTAQSQTIQISRQNRTVQVDVTQRVQVEADIANVTLGCVTYGQSHDQAYQANLEVADKVIKALLGAGVQKTQIQSGRIQLSETDSSDEQGKDRKTRQFRAHQSWQIRLAASDAQKLIDVAVRAGANGVENVSWDVADPEALEARARTAAMEKARTTAAEMAKSAGGKLGDLLYASNTVNGIVDLPIATRSYSNLTSFSAGAVAPTFSLQLFPEKVEQSASVRTVFALE
jgi:uncharacterized protein